MSFMLLGGGVAALAAGYAALRFGKAWTRGAEFVAIGVISLFVLGLALIAKAVVP